MSNQQPYKLTHGTHTSVQEERRVRIDPGVVFVPSYAELLAFGDRLERVDEEPISPNANNPQTDGNGVGFGEVNENETSLESSETDADSGEETDSNGTEQDEWPKHTGSGWYELPNGEKIQGKEKADEKYQALTEEQSAE